jgi:hypothetical protein
VTGRALALTEKIADSIEVYRAARERSRDETNWAALILAEVVLQAYDSWQAEYERLTAYQRRSLARAWRSHRRSLLLEERGEGTAGRPAVSHGREQTMDALRRHGMIDGNGYLTEGGKIAAHRAWEEAGAKDLREPLPPSLSA